MESVVGSCEFILLKAREDMIFSKVPHVATIHGVSVALMFAVTPVFSVAPVVMYATKPGWPRESARETQLWDTVLLDCRHPFLLPRYTTDAARPTQNNNCLL